MPLRDIPPRKGVQGGIQRSAVGSVCLVKQRSVSLSEEDVQSRILQTNDTISRFGNF